MTKLRLLSFGAAGVALFLPVLLPHPFVLSIATQAVIWALLAASWDLLSGYTGQVSFGHAGFFALGAYTAAAASKHLGLSPWLGLALGAAVAAVVGLGVGAMLYVCLRTRAGRAFRAIREDEVLAESLGINTTVYKLLAFGLSSGLAGLAGTLYAYYIQLVSPTVATAATTSLVIGMAVFGGLGTIWGPALGALLLYAINEGLRFIGVVYNLVAVGLVIMVFVIFLPRGL